MLVQKLAEFGSFAWEDQSPCFPASCKLRALPSFQRLLHALLMAPFLQLPLMLQLSGRARKRFPILGIPVIDPQVPAAKFRATGSHGLHPGRLAQTPALCSPSCFTPQCLESRPWSMSAASAYSMGHTADIRPLRRVWLTESPLGAALSRLTTARPAAPLGLFLLLKHGCEF